MALDKAVHFTYEEFPNPKELRQGDVIQRSEALEKVLEGIHPHYKKSDYRFFIILTQSCDLVKRGSENLCSSPYITIAAVRPLMIALEREVWSLQEEAIERSLGFCHERVKGQISEFTRKLMNNNEARYFFLFRNKALGSDEDHCAFLQLSVPLKSNLHYDVLLDAKALQLTESFQHKLGYLVGNAYSRVGTKDWVPETKSQQEFTKMIRLCVEKLEPGISWLPGAVYNQVMKELKEIGEKERTSEKLKEIVSRVGRTRETTELKILERFKIALQRSSVPVEMETQIMNFIESDKSFKTLIR